MGKVFDKHGRMKHDDDIHQTGSEVCRIDGMKVQDMDEHNAIFHPKYREDKPEPVPKRDPNQSQLYPDTAESGKTYDAEAGD